MHSTPQRVLTNQTFTTGANPQLVSYQQTDYAYEVNPVYTYASRGLLASITNTWHYKDANNAWQSKLLVGNAYTYDNAGQRLTNQINSLDAGGNQISRTEQYGYDELNRLTSVNYGDGQTQSYTFDAMGNRASKTDAGGGINGTETYGYNNANMLLSRGASNYTNDADGNTLTGGGRTNTWDSQNRMTSCVYSGNTSTFTYGSDGIRHRSVVNGTTTDFVLDQSMFVRELSGGSSKATYFMGASGPAYRRDDISTAVRWYLYDGLGSVLGEVDPNGNITATRKYDVYGAVRSSTGTSTSKHKFVGALGHPSEDETGLTYMRARYYDPQTGRFVCEDYARNGNNWLNYCSNNPVNKVDPTGNRDFWYDLFIGFLGSVVATVFCALISKGYTMIVAAMLERKANQLMDQAMMEEAVAFAEGFAAEPLPDEIGGPLKIDSGRNAKQGIVQIFESITLREAAELLRDAPEEFLQ